MSYLPCVLVYKTGVNSMLKHCNFILRSYNQSAFIFRKIFFFHLSCPIEQMYNLNEMPYVFNVGLITPLNTSLPKQPEISLFMFLFIILPHFLRFSLIFINMQIRTIYIFDIEKKVFAYALY